MKTEVNINELNNKVADRICMLRKHKGLSQRQLAQQLGVSTKTVSRWENHDGEVSLSGILGVSKVFGVSVDYLCYSKEEGEEFLSSYDVNFQGQSFEEVELVKNYIEMTKVLSFRERRLLGIVIKAIVELILALKSN